MKGKPMEKYILTMFEKVGVTPNVFNVISPVDERKTLQDHVAAKALFQPPDGQKEVLSDRRGRTML